MVYLNGLLFGMTLQLSVGPICMAVLGRSLQRGFRGAMPMVAGVALADGLYIAASFAGVASLLHIPAVEQLMLLLGAAGMLYFGWRTWTSAEGAARSAAVGGATEPGGSMGRMADSSAKAPRRASLPDAGPDTPEPVRRSPSPDANGSIPAPAATDSGFRYGLLLTLSSPLTILFWSAVFGSMVSAGTLHGPAQVAAYAGGCVSATVLFLGAVSAAGGILSRWLRSPSVGRWLNRLVGLILAAYALRLLAQAFLDG